MERDQIEDPAGGSRGRMSLKRCHSLVMTGYMLCSRELTKPLPCSRRHDAIFLSTTTIIFDTLRKFHSCLILQMCFLRW